jgi:hypothetical protein
MNSSEAKGVPDLLLSASAAAKAPPPPKVRPPPPPPPAVSDDVVLDYDEPSTTAEPEPAEPETPAEEEEDAGYIFSESTYVSLHRAPPPPEPPAYHAPLMTRFRTLRDKIHASPPRKAAATPFPRWNDPKLWRKFVSSTMPQPQWVWGMQQWEVVRLIKEFASWMEWRARVRNAARRGVPRGWPVWIWALLVKCENAMSAEEVAVVRELGKAALGLLRGMRGCVEDVAEEHAVEEDLEEEHEVEDVTETVSDVKPEVEVQYAEVEQVDTAPPEEPKPGNEEEEEGEVAETAPSQPQIKKPEEADSEGLGFCNLEDTVGMLDMIISVVGDFYGQRDLLDERVVMGKL